MRKMPRWPSREVEIEIATKEAQDVDVSYYDLYTFCISVHCLGRKKGLGRRFN